MIFLAVRVQDSPIGDIVTHSLPPSLREPLLISDYNDYNDNNDYNDYSDCSDYKDYSDYNDCNNYRL